MFVSLKYISTLWRISSLVIQLYEYKQFKDCDVMLGVSYRWKRSGREK